MDRYGGAVAADLAERGWDVVELVEAGRWKFVLSIIDRLPRTAALWQEIAEDDEAAALAALQPETSRRGTPLTEWSPEMEALAAVFDRLGEVVNAIVVNHPSGKGKPQQVKPFPRPVTAFNRARARRVREVSMEMQAKLFPDLHGGGDPA